MTSPSSPDPELTAAALSIGRDLVAGAEEVGDGCTWQADRIVGAENGKPVIGRGDVGVSLYDGTAGIALALAACVAAAEPAQAPALSEVSRAAARRALAAAPELLERGELGLYGGAVGVALGAEASGRLCGDEALSEAGRALGAEIEARLRSPQPGGELDLLGGLAGTMLGLQALVPAEGAPPALGAAAEFLSEAAEPQAWGAAWSEGPGKRPLLGFGHGAAGMALALAEAAAAGAGPAAAGAAAEAVEYERGWFDPDRGWPDLRDLPERSDPASWTVAWCHGAIGIGLSRLRLAQLGEDPILLVEASAALQFARHMVIGAGNALRAGQPSDCTSCHGLAGVVELLLVAARALGVAEHERAARRVAALILEQREAAAAWPCGLPGGGEVPALMNGTAGIALSLLRASGVVDLPTPLLPGPSGL